MKQQEKTTITAKKKKKKKGPEQALAVGGRGLDGTGTLGAGPEDQKRSSLGECVGAGLRLSVPRGVLRGLRLRPGTPAASPGLS